MNWGLSAFCLSLFSGAYFLLDKGDDDEDDFVTTNGYSSNEGESFECWYGLKFLITLSDSRTTSSIWSTLTSTVAIFCGPTVVCASSLSVICEVAGVKFSF